MNDPKVETSAQPTAEGRRDINRYLWIAAGIILLLGLVVFVDLRTGRVSGAVAQLDRPFVEEVLIPQFGTKLVPCTYHIRLRGRLYATNLVGWWIMESEDGSRTTWQHVWQLESARSDVVFSANDQFFTLLLSNNSELLGTVFPLAASGSLKHLIPGGARVWDGHEVPIVEFINPETNQKTRLIFVIKR